MRKILYLSLTGMAEPLGQSQVLEYLIDLAKKGNDITLFSFERIQDENLLPQLAEKIQKTKIKWIHRAYSNRFGLLSTVWMLITALIQLLKISYSLKPHIIHARSFLPAILGYCLAKLFNSKLLFDIRGFAIDEKVDSGRLKKQSWLYRVLHGLECLLYKKSDHIVTLTHASKKILIEELHLSEDKITVIPTCASQELFYVMQESERNQLKQQKGFAKNQVIIIHTGTVSGWYDFEKEVELFASLYSENRCFHFLVLNKREHTLIKHCFSKYRLPEDAYTIASATISEVVQWINIADVALFFIKPSYAKQASAPTKFAEFIACRVPSITNSGVGDMCYYIENYPVGLTVSLDGFSEQLPTYSKQVLQLLKQKKDDAAYEKIFSEHFDKQLAVERYDAIYMQLQVQK